MIEEYREALNQCYSKEYGILSFDNYEYHKKLNIKDEDYEYFKINNILEKYNLTFFNESKFKNKTKLLEIFLQYSYLNNLNQSDFLCNLYAYYISISNDVSKTIFSLIYEKMYSVDLVSVANIYSNNKFLYILFNSLRKMNKNKININKLDQYYKDKDQRIFEKYYELISGLTTDNFYKFEKQFIEMSIFFKLFNISIAPESTDKVDNQKFYNKTQLKIEVDILELLFGKTESQEIKDGVNKILDMFNSDEMFNPELSFMKKINIKYTTYLEEAYKSLSNCDVIKTILYLHSYITRDNDKYYPSKRMKNIVSVGSNWATGTEQTYDPSFYGNSNISKAFSAYYAFMNGNRNPYYQIINNNRYDYMEEEALKMHQYFRENLSSELLFNILYNEKLIGDKSIYDVISSVYEILKILESPIIGSSSSILSEIIGLITSMLNSIAQILDFSLSYSVKSLFYVKFIPIGENKYSVSDLYNYIIFLKLILEHAQGEEIIENISREKFVSYAFQTLGIRENEIKKIGYCGYCDQFNDSTGLNLYSDKMSKNKYGEQFTARNDLKIFYSMLQFAIMKQVYYNDNENIYLNFDFSDITKIRVLLNSLSSVEKYYIFKIHYSNFSKMKDYNFYIIDDIYEFEKNIRKIYSSYNVENVSFYKSYIEIQEFSNENGTKLEDEYEYEYFKSNIKYNNFLNTCLNEYSKKINENKKSIDKLVFEINNISNFDDFLMRFLPSIIEVMKLLNIDHSSITSIINFLDSICYFISDLLFRNLFLKIKFELIDQIKIFEKNMFNEFSDNKYIFNLNILGDSISKKIKNLLDKIDNIVLNGKDIRECFVDVYRQIEDENYYENIDGIDSDNIIINYYDENGKLTNTINVNNSNNQNYENSIKISDISNIIKNDNRKLIYNNGEIFIEDSSGNRIKVVYENDKNSNYEVIQTKDETKVNYIDGEDKNLENYSDDEIYKPIITDNEYETLIQIRDFINNITNKNIVTIINKINKIKKEIYKEQQKRLPNNTLIKKLNEIYSELTKELDYVKTKNNVYVSDEYIINSYNLTENNFVGADYKNITISNNYNGLSTAIEKKDLLEEVETIVYENNMSLTNYEIIKLLK